AEINILTDLVNQTTPESTGLVFLQVNKLVCNSCRSAILQTRALRPGIQLELLEDSLKLNIGAVGPLLTPPSNHSALDNDAGRTLPQAAYDDLGPARQLHPANGSLGIQLNF